MKYFSIVLFFLVCGFSSVRGADAAPDSDAPKAEDCGRKFRYWMDYFLALPAESAAVEGELADFGELVLDNLGDEVARIERRWRLARAQYRAHRTAARWLERKHPALQRAYDEKFQTVMSQLNREKWSGTPEEAQQAFSRVRRSALRLSAREITRRLQGALESLDLESAPELREYFAVKSVSLEDYESVWALFNLRSQISGYLVFFYDAQRALLRRTFARPFFPAEAGARLAAAWAAERMSSDEPDESNRSITDSDIARLTSHAFAKGPLPGHLRTPTDPREVMIRVEVDICLPERLKGFLRQYEFFLQEFSLPPLDVFENLVNVLPFCATFSNN